MEKQDQNQNEHLDALAAEAAAVDGKIEAAAQAAQAQPEAQAEPAQTAIDPADEARQIIDLTAFAVEKFYPVLEYTEVTKAEAAKRLTPLMVKYNLSGTLLGKWGAEIEAGMFFSGVIIASVQAVRAAKQAEADKAEMDKGGWFSRFFRWGKA